MPRTNSRYHINDTRGALASSCRRKLQEMAYFYSNFNYLIESRGQGSKRPLDKTWTRDEGRAITWVTLAGKVALVQTVPWLRSVGGR